MIIQNCTSKKKKHNYFQNQNVLDCNKNIWSMTCPVLLCNYKKQRLMNKKIRERNFPENKQKIVLNQRPRFNICMSRYPSNIDARKQNMRQYPTKENFSNITSPNKMVNVKFKLAPGKNYAEKYFNNIDTESELKNIFEKTNKCSRNFPYNKKLNFNGKYVDSKLVLNCNCECHQKHSGFFTNCSTKPEDYFPPDMGKQNEFQPNN